MNIEQEEDLEIISRVLIGNKLAYEEIVSRYSSKIIRFCSHYLSDIELGQDAAQEVFIKAFNNLKRYKPSATFSTWLFTIARNQCIDILRKQNRSPKISSTTIEDKGIGDDIPSSTISSTTYSAVEAKDLLTKVFSALPQEYREILILREAYGLKYSDIMEITDSTLDSVKARLRRARVEADNIMRHILHQDNV
jgi:RNA polymerase sigma-70 factor (ECF subfamily)